MGLHMIFFSGGCTIRYMCFCCILLVGLLYEMCVELCTARACKADDNVTVNHPLAGTPCSDADLSLVSWLQKVPTGTFACPFEKKALKLKVNE